MLILIFKNNILSIKLLLLLLFLLLLLLLVVVVVVVPYGYSIDHPDRQKPIIFGSRSLGRRLYASTAWGKQLRRLQCRRGVSVDGRQMGLLPLMPTCNRSSDATPAQTAGAGQAPHMSDVSSTNNNINIIYNNNNNIYININNNNIVLFVSVFRV